MHFGVFFICLWQRHCVSFRVVFGNHGFDLCIQRIFTVNRLRFFIHFRRITPFFPPWYYCRLLSPVRIFRVQQDFFVGRHHTLLSVLGENRILFGFAFRTAIVSRSFGAFLFTLLFAISVSLSLAGYGSGLSSVSPFPPTKCREQI